MTTALSSTPAPADPSCLFCQARTGLVGAWVRTAWDLTVPQAGARSDGSRKNRQGSPCASRKNSFHLRRQNRAAAEWHLGRRVTEAVFALSFAGALLVAVAAVHPRLYRVLVAEDSLLEWGEFCGYAAASIRRLSSLSSLPTTSRAWRSSRTRATRSPSSVSGQSSAWRWA